MKETAPTALAGTLAASTVPASEFSKLVWAFGVEFCI